MPGRVNTRKSTTTTFTNTASRTSQKSSAAPSAQSRKSTVSSPTIEIPDEGPSSTLRTRVCAIFDDAQRTAATHRKLVVRLRRIQEACCYAVTSISKSHGEGDFEEGDFHSEVARCVLRIMGVKKSEGAGDRAVKFLGLFLSHAMEKDATDVPENDVEESQPFPETPSTRLTSHILSISLPLLTSKEKTVRYRSTQLIAHIIHSLNSIDDEYFHLVKMGLLKRARDKEPTIRVQAVLGLSRLAGNEDDGDLENDENYETAADGLLEKLLDILQNDPSADVRRSLLLNLPLTPGTLPFLLERARDQDAGIRRALYSRLLPALGDFRHLSLSMREKLLRWGLRDRDETVRKSAARLFRERWIEDCSRLETTAESDAPDQPIPVNIDGLLELLERIDVVNSGDENGVALEAMKEFWDGRPDFRVAIDFPDLFWDRLTPESIFMARSFNDFCKAEGEGKLDVMGEEKIPEVTKFAFYIQQYTTNLIDCLRRNQKREESEEEDTVEQEFIVEQLLHIAKTLDYSDEAGRRTMFSLLRELLAIAELPDDITKLVVQVLRDVCGLEAYGEKEFCGVVLEAVAEVHDTISLDDTLPENEDESFHSAQSEMSDVTPTKEGRKKISTDKDESNTESEESKAIREILVNMKCLHIAQCMLQNVDGDLQQNLHLVTTLNNLVVPAVRSHEAPIRERGLICLGLCCLLDKNLAEENISLFLHCFNKGHDVLQVTALHVLCDILTAHPSLLSLPASDAALQKSVLRIFSKGLKAIHSVEVQGTATTAICKLLLTGVIQDEDVLKQAIICYFDPATRENAVVRQALSYFLPVYTNSRRENMERMARVAPSVLHAVVGLVDDLDEEEEMVGIGVVGNMLVDWTDARKLVIQDGNHEGWDEAGRGEVKPINGDIHLDLAANLLARAMGHSCTREEKKAMLPLLGKLYVTASSSMEKLLAVKELTSEAIDLKIANDAACRNGLNKFQAAIIKVLGDSVMDTRLVDGETILDVEQESKVDVDDGKLSTPGPKTNAIKMEPPPDVQDSLLEELLAEDEEEGG